MKSVKFGNALNQNHGLVVHGCNSYGVMGSGIAYQVKNRFPEAFKQYTAFIKECEATGVSPMGQCVSVEVSPSLFIVNAITQNDFGKDGKRYVKYDAVQSAFESVVALAHAMELPVHYPLIGAGLGGGEWSIISEIIDCAFLKHPNIDRTLWIFEP